MVRALNRWSRERRRGVASVAAPLTLRLADGADAPALRRLAQRDSRPLPAGPLLIAVREGRIDAALSLTGGELIADPFRPTAETAALLRAHARSASLAHGSAPQARAPTVRALCAREAT